MVPGMPGKPEESGPNPQSCDTPCSQSREWDHQGCLGHFQGGQEGHIIQVLGAQEGHPGVFPLTCFYRCLGYVLVVLNRSVPKIIIS